MRYLYSFLIYLALPFVFLRLFWRSRRLAAYRERLGERLGFYPFHLSKCIWIHAVSVGEAVAAAPLVNALVARHPDLPILVTTMTPTGSAQVQKLFGSRVKHVYIPYDLPDAAARFLQAMKPIAAIFMETEVWPNLIAACRKRSIPVCLLNARLSERSLHGYQRISSLAREMFSSLRLIAAHADADAKRFIQLGANPANVVVTGSIKFDLQVAADLPAKSAALREILGKHRFIWAAGSTHEGEELILLHVHQLLQAQYPDALLILVPRHPDRFNEVAALSAGMMKTVRHSERPLCDDQTAVYLVDTMGEMLLMYGAADAVFVGGSLISRGGHNLLEPAALGKPVLSGAHVFNFQDISDKLVAADALIKVENAEALAAALQQLAANPAFRQQLGDRAQQVVAANRGALAAQLAALESVIASVSI